MSKEVMGRLTDMLEENGVMYGISKDGGKNVCWEGDGCIYHVDERDGLLFLKVTYLGALTAEQIIDVTLAKSDQDSMQALRSKVKLQGEYINELSSKYRDLFAENNAMATRHSGQMDYVRRKLMAAVLDSGKCQFELVEPQVSFSKPMRGDRFRCTNCGCVCARGFIVDERLDHCPKCKREIFK